MFVVSWLLPTPLNGLSKELVCDTSATLRRCWTCREAAELRTAAGRPWRVHERAMADVDDLRTDMMSEKTEVGRNASN